jgi:hypothetical protein
VTGAPLLLLVLTAAPDAALPDAGATDASAPDAGAPLLSPPPLPTVEARPAESNRAAVVIQGQLFARGSRDPVGGASIIVDGLAAGETDAEGRFSLVVAPGRRILQIQQPGYQPLTHFVQAVAGLAPLELRLSAADEGSPRYETVIKGRSQDEAPVRTLSGPEITRTAGSLGDPFRVIESLPGVATMMWPLPIYAVRGANPGNTGYFLDGVRIPALFHFALGPAVIHPYFLESLDFYSGGYPARHGRYVSGIVSAATAAPATDRAHGSIDVRLFDAGGILTVPINGGKGSVALAARYAYPAGLASALVEEVRFHYWDYQLRFDHDLGPGRFSATVMGSYDLFATKSTSEIYSPDGEVTRTEHEDSVVLAFQRYDLRWRGAVGGGRLFAGLALGTDKTESAVEEDDSRGGARARNLTPRVSYLRALNPAADLELGIDGELTRFRGLLLASNPNVPPSGLTSSRTAALVGGYSSLTYRLGDRVVLTPGLRLDVFHEGKATEVDLGPRLNLRLRAGDSFWVKLTGGRASQMPSLPFQLPGIEAFELGRLGLQTAWHGGLGVETNLRGFELDATSFVQRYVLSDVRDPQLGDPLLEDFLVRRQALAYGLELMIRRPPGQRLHGWLSYTLSRSLRAFEGGVVGPSDWDQRHVLNLVVGYRWGRTTLGTRFHLHTGRLVPIGNLDPLEMERLPPFYQLDLRLDRRFIFERWSLDAYIELVNATLTRQVIDLYATRGGIEEEGFRIVLPSIGIRAEF